ncbi:MAG: hypothetical protein KGI45_02300 [Patescibacteria group bacterium]|nr:hypothetical protein [Patescibacteria group bacterium]MDE1966882.1 hypothetical protein [Patescibacteria group bacterium]
MSENMENLGYVIWEKIPESCMNELGSADLAGYRESTMQTIDDLKARRVRRIRLGVSWAEWSSPGGKACIQWYLKRYAQDGFDILPCLCFTPADLSMNGKCTGPPKDTVMYAMFVYDVAQYCKMSGIRIEFIEHWNEWAMGTDYDQSCDPEHSILARMLTGGCVMARRLGLKNLLGGMAGVDKTNLALMSNLVSKGAAGYFDSIGFHSLRGTWSDQDFPGSLFDQARSVAHTVRNTRVWLTELSFPTTGLHAPGSIAEHRLEEIQVAIYADALAHVLNGFPERIYWFALRDRRGPTLRSIHTGWQDPLQFHFGDSHEDGSPKLLGRLLIEGGQEAVAEYAKKNLDVPALLREASLRRLPPRDFERESAKPPI